MKFNVYLPDDLGARVKDEEAKSGKLRLSRLLQLAVAAELERRETMRNTLSETETYEVGLEDGEGRSYTGRITGKRIAWEDDVEVFLTNDERVIVYSNSKGQNYWVLDDPVEQLRGWLGAGAYTDALHALGESPVIDL